MGLTKQCGRFCHWLGHCMNQHNGDCVGYREPDEDDTDEAEERLERMTY